MNEYIRHIWEYGEVIDAEKLNNIEQGIVETKGGLEGLAQRLNALIGNDENLMDELQELIDYINSNKDLIDEITSSKVSVADIVNDLVTNVSNKPLSAAQGVVLKGLIDALQTRVTNHNTDAAAHSDLRAEVKALADRINAVLDSDDVSLDELSEIVAYIKSNKTLIDAITTSKVSVADIVNDLVTNVSNKPLSAAQGVVLKGLIDTLTSSVNGKAPKAHASSGTSYGAGTGSYYGHVKLSDSTSGTSNANGGVAATPAAVKAAYDLANGKANNVHGHAASDITAGTFGGRVQGNANAMATLGNAQLRNIYAGTEDLAAGSSYLPTGTLYFVYE